MNDRIRINGTMRHDIINNQLLYKFYSFFQQKYYLYLIIRCHIVFVGVSQSFPIQMLYIERWRRMMKKKRKTKKYDQILWEFIKVFQVIDDYVVHFSCFIILILNVVDFKSWI